MSAWRSGGIGPEKTSAGLRGIGLIIIVLAFLAVSNRYVSGGDEDKKPTDGRKEGTATVVAAEALRPLLPKLSTDAVYLYATPAVARKKIEDNEQADVFVTTVPADAAALAADSRCSDAVDIATVDRTQVVACLPTNVDADTALGLAYLKSITNLRARAAIIDAGYDVPTP